ncbi:MAG: hypothetical protein M1556_01170 [Candidatus Thermoplasmatota archaeon]|jgi:hypothetical protein|nr:hypothetical protein [Candidatus Thermoplasmatota archaeon]MCL6002245.1 hypothetical protein [Candidatus Thermoplasmatota archaeon]
MVTIVVSVLVVTAGVILYYNHYRPTLVITKTAVILKTGTNITLGKSGVVRYYITLKGDYIIKGAWQASSPTWMMFGLLENELCTGCAILGVGPSSPPVTKGEFNQTEWSDKYELIMSGAPGEKITITEDFEAVSYSPSQVGSFLIPGGTHFSTENNSSVKVYSIYLNRSAIFSGTVNSGTNWQIILTSALNNRQMNFWAGPGSSHFEPGYPIYPPGNYTLRIVGSLEVTQSLEFVYYFENSTFGTWVNHS